MQLVYDCQPAYQRRQSADQAPNHRGPCDGALRQDAAVTGGCGILPQYATVLRDDFVDRFGSFDADQLLIQTAVEISQSIRVQAELVQNRGVHAF